VGLGESVRGLLIVGICCLLLAPPTDAAEKRFYAGPIVQLAYNSHPSMMITLVLGRSLVLRSCRRSGDLPSWSLISAFPKTAGPLSRPTDAGAFRK
jgi:hypothetical protein